MASENEHQQTWSTQAILDSLARHQQALRDIGVQKIGLFGSYSRGTATPGSDMDFLVSLEKSSFDAYMNLKFYLEDLFACNVDVVLENNIKPRLRPRIMAEVIYAA